MIQIANRGTPSMTNLNLSSIFYSHLVIGPLVHANPKKLSRTSHMQGNLHVWFWPDFPEVSLPSKRDGFWYENRVAKTDSILIEAFFDPVCPDSRDSWPPLKLALNHYGSRVSLLVHPFPLPYHDNAFISSRALHIINKLNTSATYRLLESFFGQQEKFYGKATFNFSKASVVDKITKFTSNAIGSSNYAAIKAGFTDPKTDQATRISFKYGCVKGVYGTPFFFVNGFPLPDAGSPLDYKAWRNILDQLAGQLEG